MQTLGSKSSKVQLSGLVLLFGTAFVAGLIIGEIVHLISIWFYIIILFPVLMGLALGGLLARVVRKGKVRVRSVIILAAVFASLIAYGSRFYFDYLKFSADVRLLMQSDALKQGVHLTDADLNDLFNAGMNHAVGMSGFPGYIRLRVQKGTTITSIENPGQPGINLGVFTWLLWLVELGIVMVSAIVLVKDEAARPFCENCGRWYGKARYLGGVGMEKQEEALRLIKAQQFDEVGSLISRISQIPSLNFVEQGCDHCTASPSFLEAYLLKRRKDGKLVKTTVLTIAVSSSQNALLLNRIKQQNVQA